MEKDQDWGLSSESLAGYVSAIREESVLTGKVWDDWQRQALLAALTRCSV